MPGEHRPESTYVDWHRPFYGVRPIMMVFLAQSCFDPPPLPSNKTNKRRLPALYLFAILESRVISGENFDSMMKAVISLPFSSRRAIAWRDAEVDVIYPGEIYLHMVKHEMLLLSPCLSFCAEFRARICKHLRSPGIDSVSLCSLVGQYDNPICRTGPPGYIGWRN
jgi:hypothetical protein